MAFTQDIPKVIRSEPLKDGRPAANKAPSSGLWALAIVLFVFGAIGWLAGGKYTVEGWVIALNMFSRWIGIESTIPIPRGWLLVTCVVGAGLVYSRVELLAWHKNSQRLPVFWIGWLLIVLTDVGSTLLGILNPAPDAAPVFLQLSKTLPLALLWAGVLTAVPEYLILGAWKLLRG